WRSATPTSHRTSALRFASASMLGTSSSTAATCGARASTSPRGWKRSPSPADYACPAACRTRWDTSSTSRSRTWASGSSRTSRAPAREIAASAERFKAAAPSIMALPFVNLSGDAKQDYVADGITDSLTSDLARALPGILVVSRDTAFTYKGRGVDARQIGRDL